MESGEYSKEDIKQQNKSCDDDNGSTFVADSEIIQISRCPHPYHRDDHQWNENEGKINKHCIGMDRRHMEGEWDDNRWNGCNAEDGVLNEISFIPKPGFMDHEPIGMEGDI